MERKKKIPEQSVDEDVIHGRKSPNWDKYEEVTGFVEEGYPFKEGLPPTLNLNNWTSDTLYDIHVCDGKVVIGRPYISPFEGGGEGGWIVKGENRSEKIGIYLVVGWRLHTELENDPAS